MEPGLGAVKQSGGAGDLVACLLTGESEVIVPPSPLPAWSPVETFRYA